ncbi:hypothetical protein AA313_de0206511 [Arthrobotrys entomopaga]|nr:hypothetical protein AA313_de0206511 [Arthrobotrys entomopaga]
MSAESQSSPLSILLQFPLEVLMQIALALHPRDVKSLATTCRKLQFDLITSNELLWFKFLNILPRTSYPLCLHMKSLLLHWETGLPDGIKPLPTAEEFCRTKDAEIFDKENRYYAKVMDILNRKQQGCFDCLSPYFLRDMILDRNIGSSLDSSQAGLVYRTYCCACQEKYFWSIPRFQAFWHIAGVPSRYAFYAIVSKTSEDTEYADIVPEAPLYKISNRFIHREDAITVLKREFPLDALLPATRFVHKWRRSLKFRINCDPKGGWSKLDVKGLEQVVSEFIGIIVDDIYTMPEYAAYHKLKSPRAFRVYLEEHLIEASFNPGPGFLKNLPLRISRLVDNSPISEVILQMAYKVRSIDRITKDHPRIWDILCESDPDMTSTEYDGIAPEKDSRYKYIHRKCQTMLNMAFDISTDTEAEFDDDSPWEILGDCLLEFIHEYHTGRFGSTENMARYCPSECPFCGRGGFGIKEEWGEDWNGVTPCYDTPVSVEFKSAYGLLGHIWSSHNERFSEKWELQSEDKYEDKYNPWEWLDFLE